MIGFLKQQLELLADDHPARKMTACINQGQVKFPCSACEDICPQQVYSGTMGQNADFSACVNCNLCVSACPARCIAPSALNVSAYLRTLRLPQAQIVVSAQGGGHLNVPTLAALPWEFLALLGMKKRVVLLMGRQTQEETELLKKTLTRLVVFFGSEGYRERFVLAASMKDVPQVDRRALIQMAGDTIKSRLFPLQLGEDGGLMYRGLLHQQMRDGKFGFPVPIVEASCTGCGVCAMLCPQKAIRIKKDNGGFSVILDPLRCNGCGLCEKTCIERAISEMGVVCLEDMTPVRLFRKEKAEKENCYQ